MLAWFELDPARYQAERKFWLNNGFQEERSGGKVRFVGAMEVAVGGRGQRLTRREFKLRVTYPTGYPYRTPSVEFVEPRVQRARHQSPTGEPCLFPPREWTRFTQASQVHRAIARWLRGWMLGSYPRELAIYELPEYYLYSPLSILTTPEAFTAFAGKTHGRFSVLRATGRDLAVLKSVDGRRVADRLLDGLRFGAEVRQDVANGKWFRLEEEPPFVRYSSELGAVLTRNGYQWDAGRPPSEHGFVGLVFEDNVLNEERLLILDFSAKKKAKRDPRGWSLRSPSVPLVSHEELFRRLEGVHSVEALHESNVVMLGLGAIGSSIALDLAREGVGGFVLCDPDRLRPGNVMRNALDLFSVGLYKGDATELAIGRINPYADTWAESDNLREPGVLENLMREHSGPRGADLVVSAIGDDTMEGPDLGGRGSIRERAGPVCSHVARRRRRPGDAPSPRH